MIQVIGIPIGSEPAPFFANLFLAQKEALRHSKSLEKSMFEKSIIPFSLLLSLKDDSSFEKHYKDIYAIELELGKDKNTNSCASFLNMYIYIENG